jgi:hypothetical protein
MTEQLEVTTTLLEALETAVVPAIRSPVTIRDGFKKNASIRISAIFAEFKNRFFDKIEGPTPEVTYRKYELLCICADGPIISELGGESQVEGTFAAVFKLLQAQPKGQAGFLQTNGNANIFYARDKQGELCAIRLGWVSDGWVIDAMQVADPMAWHGHHLIFCPL